MIFIAIESMLGDIDQKAAWLAANPWIVIFGILLGLASIIVNAGIKLSNYSGIKLSSST